LSPCSGMSSQCSSLGCVPGGHNTAMMQSHGVFLHCLHKGVFTCIGVTSCRALLPAGFVRTHCALTVCPTVHHFFSSLLKSCTRASHHGRQLCAPCLFVAMSVTCNRFCLMTRPLRSCVCRGTSSSGNTHAGRQWSCRNTSEGEEAHACNQ
jgi:hypothetical protein